MRRLAPALLSASLMVGCGPTSAESESPAPSTERQEAPLTTTDVDVAPECQGLLTFVNTEPLSTLSTYLPSDVAQSLVSQRATAPFSTLVEVSAVRGISQARLARIEDGARTLGYVGSTCAGVLDELALSTDDAAALVHLVNTIDSSALYAVLPYAWNGATNLLNLRPFTSAQAISEVSGVGTVSLRNLRNAATQGYALTALIAAINAQEESLWTSRLSQDFDIQDVIDGAHGNGEFQSASCFGIDPSLFPAGQNWTVRPNLATGTEVYQEIEGTVGYADRNEPLPDTLMADGLAELQARTAGRTFNGCFISYGKGPWGGIQVKFYVDTVTGYRILSEQHWVE
ncbi:hypothetical protein [Corallococcus macrosporus]|uniref:Lipoprotein n=1 Tax=Corallococcus macrosporus DSM 14697 TaxID=1189310 RepID=A0A250JSV3_9BACT|nr:hypothetical protein [Corallococcus macrosporus]ATB46186.1 lipoprotein [Corallococcus macrosporus DSM 14697]